jgi:adenosylhomocysteine nucleosidase
MSTGDAQGPGDAHGLLKWSGNPATMARMSTLQSLHRNRLGVVTGLIAEARLAAPLGIAAAGGGGPAGAARAAERLVAQGVSSLVSFGLCGGLDPALPAGSLVVPREVIATGRRYPTCPRLSAAVGGWSADSLLAGHETAADPASKRRQFDETGAAAIDLESGAVAEVAARAGLPFAVLRAVCDPAGALLPPAALAALDALGAISIWSVAASLLRHPGQIFDLIALGHAAAAARAALVRRVGDISAGRLLVP